MTGVVTKALKDMRARQKELAPLAAEFKQVEAAIQALESADSGLEALSEYGEGKEDRRATRPSAQGRAHPSGAVLRAREGASWGDHRRGGHPDVGPAELLVPSRLPAS